MLAAINTARYCSRPRLGCGRGRPLTHCAQGGLVVVDLDASLLTAHSEKESAAPTYKAGVRPSPVACVR